MRLVGHVNQRDQSRDLRMEYRCKILIFSDHFHWRSVPVSASARHQIDPRGHNGNAPTVKVECEIVGAEGGAGKRTIDTDEMLFGLKKFELGSYFRVLNFREPMDFPELSFSNAK